KAAKKAAPASAMMAAPGAPAAPEVDLPPESSNRVLNCVPSPEPERDWGVAQAAAAGALEAGAPPPPAPPPRGGWGPGSAREETGSCVGQAAADGVCRWHFVESGRLPRSRPLSPRYLWMAAKETDQYTDTPSTFLEREGTSLKAALDIARRYGVVTEGELPFK